MLKDTNLIVTITSTITTPLVVAVFGWYMQSSIAAKGIDKDYMAIAVNILNNPDSNKSLKDWAIRVLDKNSPVPISKDVESELGNLKGIKLATEIKPPADLTQPCPPLSPLAGTTGADILPWAVQTVYLYKDCAARHDALVSVFK